jgi:WD40 repeat protein
MDRFLQVPVPMDGYSIDFSVQNLNEIKVQVILFGGQEGEKVGELVDSSCKEAAAHGGGVFALSWNLDGNRLVTASGDKTLKIWNVPDRKLIS